MRRSLLFILLCLCATGAGRPAGWSPPQTRGEPRAPRPRVARECPIQDRAEVQKIRGRAFRDPSDENLEAFLCTLPTFVNPLTNGTYYVVEGDIPMTEAEVRDYLHGVNPDDRAAEDEDKLAGSELVVNLFGGARDYYRNVADRTLRYAVDRQSFAEESKFEMVRANLRRAADEWEALCPSCQIRFVDVTDPRVRPRHGPGVNFIVGQGDLKGALVAHAFYPHDSGSRRILTIDPTYYTTDYDEVGVMRHELGHVLGYRHEHIADKFARQVPGCAAVENRNWERLTDYQPQSVMHYFCGALGSLRLEFTDSDGVGHEQLYRLPRPAPAPPPRPGG